MQGLQGLIKSGLMRSPTRKKESLIPELKKSGFLLDSTAYESADAPLSQFLLEVPDFNSLIAVSQTVSKPVFALNQDDIGSSGVVLDVQEKNIDDFNEIYESGAEKIINLTNG